MNNKNKTVIIVIAVAMVLLGSVVFLAKRLANQSAKMQKDDTQQSVEDKKINDIIQQYSNLPPEGKKKFEIILDRLVKQYAVKQPGKEDTAGKPFKPSFVKGIKINWQDAAKYVGQYVIVQGIIVSSYYNGQVCFLNFDKNYGKSLALTIFGYNLKKFHEHPEKFYFDKTIAACGIIKQYKGRYEIILTDAGQIELANE